MTYDDDAAGGGVDPSVVITGGGGQGTHGGTCGRTQPALKTLPSSVTVNWKFLWVPRRASKLLLE